MKSISIKKASNTCGFFLSFTLPWVFQKLLMSINTFVSTITKIYLNAQIKMMQEEVWVGEWVK